MNALKRAAVFVFCAGGALGYCLMPVDLLPDAIPVVGWIDDLVLSVFLLYTGVRIDVKGK